jgi:hypothetical protein
MLSRAKRRARNRGSFDTCAEADYVLLGTVRSTYVLLQAVYVSVRSCDAFGSPLLPFGVTGFSCVMLYLDERGKHQSQTCQCAHCRCAAVWVCVMRHVNPWGPSNKIRCSHDDTVVVPNGHHGNPRRLRSV